MTRWMFKVSIYYIILRLHLETNSNIDRIYNITVMHVIIYSVPMFNKSYTAKSNDSQLKTKTHMQLIININSVINSFKLSTLFFYRAFISFFY